MSGNFSGLKAQVNQQVELQWRSRVRQETIKTDIEVEKERGLRHDLTAERFRSTQKSWKAQSEGLRAQQEYVSYLRAGVSLANTRLQLDIDRVGHGVLQDQLAYARADRALGQMEQRAKLTIKAISVAELREQVRHDTAIKGGPAPFLRIQAGNAYALPQVAGIPAEGFSRQ